MARPFAITILALLCATGAHAGDRYVPRELPAAFSATAAPARPHTPSPFPDDQELEFKGDGPNGWVILGGVLGAGAVLSGLVSAGSAARMGSPDTSASERENLRRTRNAAGITALGLAGGSGLCLGIAVAR